MSVWTSSSSVLAIKPKIWIQGEQLRARSSLLAQLLTLFSYEKLLIVDRDKEKIGIRTRRLWCFTSRRTISFARVHYVESEFGGLGTSWGLTSEGFEATDQLECFTVWLVLKEPDERVKLFTFMGEGARETGWAGVLLGGDSMVDFSGDQEQVSRNFLWQLKTFIGVSVGKPLMHLTDTEGNAYFCTECGRPAPPSKDKCLYCGGPVAAGEHTSD